MRLTRFTVAAIGLLLLASLAIAAQNQGADRGVSDTKPLSVPGHKPVGTVAKQAAHKVPLHPGCWQKAGISKAEMAERRAIQERTRAEVEAVCSNPALTEQQKRQEIQQIHQSAQQQLMGTLTPEQRAILEQCQRANAHPHPHMGGGGAPSPGPCGFLR